MAPIEQLQNTVEQLKASNQAILAENEELRRINAELSQKVDELNSSNTELQVFFRSAQVPIIFLDTQLRLKQFTPAACIYYIYFLPILGAQSQKSVRI